MRHEFYGGEALLSAPAVTLAFCGPLQPRTHPASQCMAVTGEAGENIAMLPWKTSNPQRQGYGPSNPNLSTPSGLPRQQTA